MKFNEIYQKTELQKLYDEERNAFRKRSKENIVKRRTKTRIEITDG
ncbi:unnamed protein product [Arabidopsis thaliana]|uniref:Uncharacterized protein n=1 Tax=Arabidopsis thaliana TaxID=3702 RepID=Q9LJG0_ARATH|nr:unnamed protein product [Arabidopsis thaliana]